jgi:phosphinothricin acetyltransferase
MIEQLKIRMASTADCASILSIYKYYVLNTCITFEYDVPSVEEMENRMKSIQTKYPYLVAEIDGKIIGYAYATDFRFRAAYQWSPECAIYLDNEMQGKGIGKILYQTLFSILKLQGFYNVFGGVGLPNEKSVQLHLKCGFEEIGTYKNIGYKHGKWHSTQWFQIVLNEHKIDPTLPKKMEEIQNTTDFKTLLSNANLKLPK